MRNSSFFRISSILGLTLLVLAACSVPTRPDASPASSGGKSVLTIGAGNAPASKTVLPSAPAIAGYTLSADSGSGFQTVTTFSTVPATALINQGTYDFKLEATDGSGNVVLAQVQLGVVVGEPSLDLNFTLTPLTGGPGDVLVTISWPSTVAVASVDTIFGPLGGAQTTAAAAIVSNSVTFSQNAVDSGNYLLTISMKDSDGVVIDTVVEVVRVFKNLVSTKTIALATTDFNAPPTPPVTVTATLNGAQANVAWTDSSNNELGFVLERSADSGTTWNVLTTPPLLAGTTNFADKNLTAGGTFAYRVKAFNTFGNSTATASAPITQFPVIYDGNGSTSGTVPTDTTRYPQGATVTVRGNTGSLVRAGFNLGGWNTSPDGLGTSYGLTAASFPLNTLGVTLYAVWIPTTMTFASSGTDITITGPSNFNGALTIPNGVTSVGANAFGGAFLLTSVVLPASLRSIGSSSFQSCGNLTSVVIPNGVASIGSSAFSTCVNLNSVVLPGSVTSIGSQAFQGCFSLSNIVLPTGLINLGRMSFAACNHLGSIVIPGSVVNIADNAFLGCTSLTSAVILNGVTSISQEAFSGCTALNSVVIPSSVTSMVSPFPGCTSLNTVSVDVASLSFQFSDGALFNKDGTQLIEVLSARIGAYTIPSSVTAIGNGAFEKDAGLTAVIIPNSVTSIGQQAFEACTSLTSLVIPSSVNSIGGDETCLECTALSSVTLQSVNPPVMHKEGNLITDAFSGTANNFQIHVPAGSLAAYQTAPLWSDFASKIVSP